MITVAPLSSTAEEQAAYRQSQLTKPGGALGRLEDAATTEVVQQILTDTLGAL